MSRLGSLLSKISDIKEKVQKGAKFDKINLADDVKERSKLATRVVSDNSRIFIKGVLGEDETVQQEDRDLNRKSSASFQEFVFSSVDENPDANKISIRLVADSSESISVKKKAITVNINDGVSDHDSIKALIDGDSRASALIEVAINAGQGAVVVTAEDRTKFTGAL